MPAAGGEVFDGRGGYDRIKPRPITGESPMNAVKDTVAIDLAREADFSVGRLQARPSSREIAIGGDVSMVEPRVMQVLVALARRRGQVISRDQLIQECWDGRVVGEDAIQRCIAKLRRMANEANGVGIETIARVGYRLTETDVAAPSATPASIDTQALPPARRSSRRRIIVAAVMASAMVLFGMTQWRNAVAQREENAALAEIAALVKLDRYGAAFARARPLIDNNRAKSEAFRALWDQIVLPMKPLVDQFGATVYFKPYDDPSGDWLKAGVTPIEAYVDAPRGTLRVKVEKPGFRTGYFVIANPGPSVRNPPAIIPNTEPPDFVPLPLAASNDIPDDMVNVPRTNVPVYVSGWVGAALGDYQFDIPAFAIARREVTNREYKDFIDAGGYDNPTYWQGLEFKDEGRVLSWEEARQRFVDKTGRAGPAEWQLSAYPTGQESMPVGGISWYEAVAYARFRGRMLPTIHHWARAAFAPYEAIFGTAPPVALASHFSATAPVSAETDVGVGPWGTFNTAGNVREWVWNFAGNDALAMGGAWSDYPAQYLAAYTTQPMQRLPQHGVRLMSVLGDAPIDAALLQPIRLINDDPRVHREPVSDDAFKAMLFQFTAAHVKPTAQRVQVIEETPLRKVEEVTLDFGAADTLVLYVVTPNKLPARPLQAVLMGPGGYCCLMKRSDREALEQLPGLEFLVNGGRALVLPIWARTYSRMLPATLDPKVRADRQRQAVLSWHQDFVRTIDYLETRADIDPQRIAYAGFSFGASTMGPIGLAIEPRLKAAVLVAGGIPLSNLPHPMLDSINYLPRVTAPVLMINGRYDHHFPHEQSQQRFFKLLGTPPQQKLHIVYDIGHFQIPPNSVARNVADWLDKQLGAP